MYNYSKNTQVRLILLLLLLTKNIIFDTNAIQIKNYEETVEFYKDLIHKEKNKAYNYRRPKDNGEFWKGKANTSEIIETGFYDFIIIGAGTAGTVIARGLSDITSVKVLLIEAGGPETAFSDIPGMRTYLVPSRMNWGYTTTSQKHSCFENVDNKCDFPRAKVIGGCSTINSVIYTRGNKEDFNRWQNLGNPGWSYKDMLPYFINQEKSHAKGDDGYHGYKGLLDVEPQTPTLPLTERYLKAFEEIGQPVLDFNGANHIGVGTVKKFTKKGRRVSGGKAFLEPVMYKNNLKVIENALATKILIEKESAVGVEFVKFGQNYKAYSTKEVIVSSGSINTPQLLMLSGIGPKEDLSKYNIPLVKDLPVGQNLQDHLYIPTAFSTNTFFNTSLEEYIAQFVNGLGPLTNGGGDAVLGFIQINKTLPKGLPDVEMVFTSPNSLFTFNGKRSKYSNLTQPNPTNAFYVYVVILKPKSVGSIKLQSDSPLKFPLIDTNYLSDPNDEDIETYYQATNFLLNLTQTEALKEIEARFFDRNIPPCKKYELYSREYFYCHARNLGTTLFHPCCTARMGPEGQNSVVDYRLKVHGIKKLRVADASVMPEIISGHTSAVVFVIGQKAINFILEDNNLKPINSAVNVPNKILVIYIYVNYSYN